MSEDIRKMIDKIKNLKFINENTLNEKYYGVFNVHGEFNNGTPLFLITPTKEEMIYKLNHFIENNIPARNQFQYTLDDFNEDSRIYMGEKLSHYINDDWCMVTDDENIFKSDFKSVENYIGVKLEEYLVEDYL